MKLTPADTRPATMKSTPADGAERPPLPRLDQLDSISRLNCAGGENLRPQAAPMDQSFAHRPSGDPFQVPAWLAQANPTQCHAAGAEFAADEVVERHPVGHNIAPAVPGAK